MAKRYELSDSSWELIEDLITQDQKTERPRHDDRLMLNGILWVLCSGAAWRDIPERFGPWSTVYQHFRDWRSRGGLTTKIHMLCDSNGILCVSTCQVDRPAILLMRSRCLIRFKFQAARGGRLRKRCRWLLADKGYDAEHLRRYCDRYRMQPVIPLRTMKRKPKLGLPRLFDKPKYRQRNIIERMFGWLKENRRIGTRYDKLAKSFGAMVSWLAPCGVYDITLRTLPSIVMHKK